MHLRALLPLAALAAALLSPAAPARAQGQPMPAWCAVWFDGCNTCTRTETGAVGCTKKFCTRYEAARCLRRTAGRGQVPSWCRVWYDGCNTCTRSANGQLRCTRRYCTTRGPSRCVRKVGE